MRKILSLMVVVILITVGAIMIIGQNQFVKIPNEELKEAVPILQSKQAEKQLKSHMQGDLFSWINKNTDSLIKEYGEPLRKDVSAYGYTWWVYNKNEEQYVQFGVEEDEVKTIYTTGDGISVEPFAVGATYDELNEQFSFKDEVTYQEGLSFYTFLLNQEDMISQPLIKLSKELFVQCYFDTVTNELSSLRLLTGDILLRQRFYEMQYRGNIPDALHGLDDKWENIEEGLQLQIFDLTNIMRGRHNTKPLIWDEDVSEVAYGHSKDMSTHNYFSHYRQDGSGLKERLAEKEIYYFAAGENIAAQHSDAPAAVHGWLNSESHREALLNDDYNYLGVGVYRLYYTQNFIFKP